MQNNLLLSFTTDLFPTHRFWLNLPLHASHFFSKSGNAFPSCSSSPTHMPCSNQLLQFNFFSTFVFSLLQQCPCCLQNTIPVNIFPSFCPLAGLFHLKGGSVVFFGFAVSFFGFFQREREKGRVSPVFLFLQTADSRAR